MPFGTARSDNSTLQSFKEFDYKKGLGPGLYDIHSPVVPTVEDLQAKLEGENSNPSTMLTICDRDRDRLRVTIFG